MDNAFRSKKILRLVPIEVESQEEKTIIDFFNKLAERQQPIPPDIAKIIQKNFRKLLEP